MPPQTDASDQNVQTPALGRARNRSIWRTGARFALFGLVINVLLAAAKILAGIIGHAYVLIADGIESALDVGGSIVIWAGLTVAARPPDRTHPYGHGKAEPIAAIIVAVASFGGRGWPRSPERARNFFTASRASAVDAGGVGTGWS